MKTFSEFISTCRQINFDEAVSWGSNRKFKLTSQERAKLQGRRDTTPLVRTGGTQISSQLRDNLRKQIESQKKSTTQTKPTLTTQTKPTTQTKRTQSIDVNSLPANTRRRLGRSVSKGLPQNVPTTVARGKNKGLPRSGKDISRSAKETPLAKLIRAARQQRNT